MSKRKKRLPSPGRNLSTEEKIDIAKTVCELYASDKYTLESCINQAGIKSQGTWHSWCNEIEEIEKLYIEAQHIKAEQYYTNAVNRAKTSLERYLDGWTIELLEQEAVPTNKTGEVVITKTKRKQVYIRPSQRLIEFVLVNLDGKKFTKNPEPFKAGNERISTDVKIEIRGPIKNPVITEDDITDIDTDQYIRDYKPL